MPTDLAGKPILITGAGSGIGRATALACARAGMPVVAMGRREQPLRALADEVARVAGPAPAAPGSVTAAFQPSRPPITTITGDVASPEDCARAVDACMETYGSVYAVFANAGYGVEKAVHEMTDRELRDLFEVNLFGSMHTLRPAIPHMLKAGRGHALLCSSCVSKFTLPFYGAYAATKAAQNHLARAMRLELEPFGVHVSSVHPVGTRTEFFNVVGERSGSSSLVKHSPDFFLQRPETVARAIVRCLRRPCAEVWTSHFTRFGMAVAMPFPRLSDFFIRGMVAERRRNIERAAADAARSAPRAAPAADEPLAPASRR